MDLEKKTAKQLREFDVIVTPCGDTGRVLDIPLYYRNEDQIKVPVEWQDGEKSMSVFEGSRKLFVRKAGDETTAL